MILSCGSHLLAHLFQVGFKVFFIHIFCQKILPAVFHQFFHCDSKHFGQITVYLFESRIYPGIIAVVDRADHFHRISCLLQRFDPVQLFPDLLFTPPFPGQYLPHHRQLQPPEL